VTATWLPIDPLTLSATVLHVSDWLDVTRSGSTSVAPGYTMVNLRGDYAFNQVKVFGRVDSPFNEPYQNPTSPVFWPPVSGGVGGVRVASYGVK
jgi:vitamin B12 transporter